MKTFKFLMPGLLLALVLGFTPTGGSQTIVHNQSVAASGFASTAWTAKEQRCLNGVQTNGARGMGKGTVRYGGQRYRENTTSSDNRAVSLGVCGFEGDLRGAAGSCVVRNHDASLRRVHKKRGRVATASCSTLVRRGLATFEQTIDAMARRSSCFAILEIKAIRKAVLESKIRYAAQKLKDPRCLTFTSGSSTHLAWVKSIDRRFPTGLIRFANNSRPDVNRVSPKYVDMLMVHYSQATSWYVRAAKARGFEVSARKVTSVAVFNRVKAAGVTNVNGSATVLRSRS